MSALSVKLKQARTNAGLSQNELGRMLGYESGQFVSTCERGVATFPVTKLKALARWTRMAKQELVEAYADDARQYAKKMIGI